MYTALFNWNDTPSFDTRLKFIFIIWIYRNLCTLSELFEEMQRKTEKYARLPNRHSMAEKFRLQPFIQKVIFPR